MEPPNTIEFGTDGIRGVAGVFPLDPITVLRIGRAIGQWLAGQGQSVPSVLIGRDTRLSGDMLASALTAGLLAQGVQVADTGVISTPGVAFLTKQGGFGLGIVISASHNPFEQNGIKLFGADGFKLPDAAEEAIEALIAAQPDNAPSAPTLGTCQTLDARTIYVKHLVESLPEQALRGLKVVLDCAHGAAFSVAPQAFAECGAQVFVLNAEPNGVNINVNAGSEHVRRDRSAMLAMLRAHDADLGIAFDGDADRVICVTPNGMLIDGDHMLGILAVSLQERGQLAGESVVATDMSNSGLADYLAVHGIALSRTKVGDRYVMERLREGLFTLGGEQAGHIILLDGVHGAGDGIYIGLLMASLAAARKAAGLGSLSEIAAQIPRYPQVIASAHLKARVDLTAVEGLAEAVEAVHTLFEDRGRVNLRFSGTEPNLLRAMVEGGANNTMQQVIESALRLCGMVAAASGTENPTIDIVDCVSGEPIHL